jgi:hypothetical protein
MLLERHFVNGDHVHRFMVRTDDVEGWIVREDEDSTVLCEKRQYDWRHVEWAALLFERTAALLERKGWVERPPKMPTRRQ